MHRRHLHVTVDTHRCVWKQKVQQEVRANESDLPSKTTQFLLLFTLIEFLSLDHLRFVPRNSKDSDDGDATSTHAMQGLIKQASSTWTGSNRHFQTGI